MPYSAKIIADSVSEAGARLTTFELTYPLIVHNEFMTHRAFCLAGDAMLEFDLPAGTKTSSRRVHRMRIDEFVDKWIGGARRIGAKPKREVDLSWIDPSVWYPVPEVTSRLGMANTSNLNGFCRSETLQAKRSENGKTWLILGSSILKWRTSKPVDNRFDMRTRLAGMRIRQFNESTGDIQWAHVTDACISGVKSVFEVRAGDYMIAGSANHRILTTEGWKTIGHIIPGDMIIARRFGIPEEERLDPLRLKKFDGVWRSRWQIEQRKQLIAEDPLCRRCQIECGDQIHHIIPVYQEPSLVFDPANITLLCEACHNEAHRIQGWQQGGTHLYGAAVRVDEIVYRGEEPTYDLTISGDNPNFLANGIVVHNSRNSASMRAVPTATIIEMVESDPFIPIYWGKNQRGMVAEEELTPDEIENARTNWLWAAEESIKRARGMAAIGMHKQIVNRLLSPWSWITVVVSATDYRNFLALRCAPDAQPEIRRVALLMLDLYVKARPVAVRVGGWHLPYVTADELAQHGIVTCCCISVGRCGRVSLYRQGVVKDVSEDIAFHDREKNSGHWSPFEHQAYALPDANTRSGNFVGWHQYRQEFRGQDGSDASLSYLWEKYLPEIVLAWKTIEGD